MTSGIDLSGVQSDEPLRLRRGQYAAFQIRFSHPIPDGETQAPAYDLTGCVVHVRIFGDGIGPLGIGWIELPVTMGASTALVEIMPLISASLPSVAELGISVISAGGQPRPLASIPIYVEGSI